jgi:high-affinity Fe2+/Pb2+ permease
MTFTTGDIISLLGVAMMAGAVLWRVGRIEKDLESSRAERKEAFEALGQVIAGMTATIAEKSEKAAGEHAKYEAKLDEHGRRIDGHDRLFDDHGHRITKLETGVRK